VQQEPSRSKRQLTAKVKDWAPPFRPEYYDNHHKAQHSTRWQVYQSLSHDQKQSYFDDRIPYKDTIFNHFGQQNGHLGWEKDEYRQSLTDLSLEGIMQCKQFELLADLTYREC